MLLLVEGAPADGEKTSPVETSFYTSSRHWEVQAVYGIRSVRKGVVHSMIIITPDVTSGRVRLVLQSKVERPARDLACIGMSNVLKNAKTIR